MTPLRQRMLEDMQLRGLAPRTQGCYVQVVLQFARHYGKSPEQITEDELRAYFLYLLNEKQVAPGTLSTAVLATSFIRPHKMACCKGRSSVFSNGCAKAPEQREALPLGVG